MEKRSRLHGMTSDKAYRVKTRGNRKEDIFAKLIDGLVIKSTKKQDVMDSYEQFFSIKGSGEKKGGEGRDGRLQIFMYKNDEFCEHYHKRSNVETCFHMIKTKFEERLRSKSQLAQTNELLLKILCHNICVVIQEICELGIKAEFCVEETKEINSLENSAFLVDADFD